MKKHALVVALGLSLAAVSAQAAVLSNIAGSATASASTVASTSKVAAYAIDNNVSTKWQPSTSAAGGWLQLSFASAQSFGRVLLSESGAASGSFQIQVLNGTTWSTVASGSKLGANKILDFAQTSGTAIRLYFDAVQPGKPQIAEFQVYAPAVTGAGCRAGDVLIDATVDCGGITVGTSCAGGSEAQQPIFTLKNSTIRNVHLKAGGAADGIHCVSGNCRLENVVWDDVCEDAATLKDAGLSMTVSGGSANAADDKVFQHNSKNSTVNIENFQTFNRIGKLYRSCGDCTNNGGPRYVNITNVQMNGSNGAVAGINSNYGDKAKIRNLRIKNWSYPDGNAEVCLVHTGVEKGSGSSSVIGIEWGTANCDVTAADVSRI